MVLDPLLHTHKLTHQLENIVAHTSHVLCICRCKQYQGGIPEIERIVHNQFHRGLYNSHAMANNHWQEMNDQDYRFV